MLTERTIEELYRHYDSPSPIFSVEDFSDDAMRIVFVAKLLTKYRRGKDTNARLLVNHIVILSNVFPGFYLIALREYMTSIEGLNPLLNSVLAYMHRLEFGVPYDEEFYHYITENLDGN